MLNIRSLFLIPFLFAAFSGLAYAKNPDFTKGEKPNKKLLADETWNLGPTGLRGFIYQNRGDSGESRQILVTTVSKGSPAEKDFKVGDVILGVSGDGRTPEPFSADARKSFGLAITAAEAKNPAILKVVQWRGGNSRVVSLKLRTLGAYSKTAPYNCPKSKWILEMGIRHIMANKTRDSYGLTAMTLLAAHDPEHPKAEERMARIRKEMHKINLSEKDLARYTSGNILPDSKITWGLGHCLITQAEYYLHTGDKAVLPSIRARAIQYSNGQSMFGTSGHQLSVRADDGSLNGPYGFGYGAINSANMPAWLGLILAQKCNLENAPEVAPAVKRGAIFHAAYVDRGAIPYGEHDGFPDTGANGRSGMAALAFQLIGDHPEAKKYFTKLAASSVTMRDKGHQTPYFNYKWSPLGANVGGGRATASYLSRASWLYDLSRNWDGSFAFDSYTKGKNGEDHYSNHRLPISTAYLLTYATPLQQLHITGKSLKESNWLSPDDVQKIEYADGYNEKDKSTKQLIKDLGSWSPVVRHRISRQLGRSQERNSLVPIICKMALTSPSRYQRIGATTTLGKMHNKAPKNITAQSAAALAKLITDPDPIIVSEAANAMRRLPVEITRKYADLVMKRTAELGKPVLPIDPKDPLHLTHYHLCMLLFYFGGEYGPAGILANDDLKDVDRALLYPAIEAVAQHPRGFARAVLRSVYPKLNKEDLKNLAGVVVDSIAIESPADKMFADGVRNAGMALLHKYQIAEGVPLAVKIHEDMPRQTFDFLKKYAGASLGLETDLEILNFIEFYSKSGKYKKQASEALVAVKSTPQPVELTRLKSIDAISANPSDLKLPSKSLTLSAKATLLTNGKLIYTWKKVHGAGDVTFSPNGNSEAANTQVSFDGKAGKYRFQLTLTDSQGFSEVKKSIDINLKDASGRLPSNKPPTAKSRNIQTTVGTPTPFSFSGMDPDGKPLFQAITQQPAHGYLETTPEGMIYRADVGFSGKDTVIYEVMDSEGASVTGKLDFIVKPLSKLPVAIYEPFNYNQNVLNGATNGGEIGLSGAWKANKMMLLSDQNLGYAKLPVLGKGVSMAKTFRAVGGTRAIKPSALLEKGLLNDGATLWVGVNFAMETSWHSDFAFALSSAGFHPAQISSIKDEAELKGAGVGFSVFKGGYYATQFNDKSQNESLRGTKEPMSLSVPAKENKLIVMKITWGAEKDRIELYQPSENLRLPNTAASILETKVDQSRFDTLTFSYQGNIRLDELRMGSSYQSVIQGNSEN